MNELSISALSLSALSPEKRKAKKKEKKILNESNTFQKRKVPLAEEADHLRYFLVNRKDLLHPDKLDTAEKAAYRAYHEGHNGGRVYWMALELTESVFRLV